MTESEDQITVIGRETDHPTIHVILPRHLLTSAEAPINRDIDEIKRAKGDFWNKEEVVIFL